MPVSTHCQQVDYCLNCFLFDIGEIYEVSFPEAIFKYRNAISAVTNIISNREAEIHLIFKSK
jgi:hypothetical protein